MLSFLAELSCTVYLLFYLGQIVVDDVPFIIHKRQVIYYTIAGIILFALNWYHFGIALAIKPILIAVVIALLRAIFTKKKKNQA
jgi:uncharacterized membrane protein (DUF106 family)